MRGLWLRRFGHGGKRPLRRSTPQNTISMRLMSRGLGRTFAFNLPTAMAPVRAAKFA